MIGFDGGKAVFGIGYDFARVHEIYGGMVEMPVRNGAVIAGYPFHVVAYTAKRIGNDAFVAPHKEKRRMSEISDFHLRLRKNVRNVLK